MKSIKDKILEANESKDLKLMIQTTNQKKIEFQKQEEMKLKNFLITFQDLAHIIAYQQIIQRVKKQ